MRRFILLALPLLLTTIARAQVVEEQPLTFGPFRAASADRSFAVAVAPHGLLMAWSAVDQGSKLAVIHTALLDFDGQPAGPIHTIPAVAKNVHAATPLVATDGEGFFVAWLERNRYSNVPVMIAGVLTDGSGKPAGEARDFGLPTVGPPAALVWDGLTYRLYGSEIYYITPDGTPSRRGFSGQRVPFTTPDANGWVDWQTQPRRVVCPFFLCGGFPAITPAAYTLDWAVVTPEWIRTGSRRETGYEAATPVVVAHENDQLIVWGTPAGLKALRVDDGVEGASFSLDDFRAKDVTPALAESLVVFEKDRDIFGTVISGNTFSPVFPISTGEGWDTAPRAQLVGKDRYLVTFTREGDGDDVYLVGRFVTISP